MAFTTQGIVLLRDSISSNILHSLTLYDELDSNTVITQCYIIHGKRIYLPFAFANRLTDITILKNTLPEYIKTPPLFDFGLIMSDISAAQAVVINYLFSMSNKQILPRFLLQEDTGRGKTRIMLALAAKLKWKTLVVVPVNIIKDQWIQEIANTLELHDGIDILIINSAWKLSSIELSKYGLIILDEVHEYCTGKFSNILWAPVKMVVGMTATPNDRLDGKDWLNVQHLNDPIIAESLTDYNIPVQDKFNVEIKKIQYVGLVQYTIPEMHFRNGKSEPDFGKTVSKVIQDPNRTQVIISIAKTLYVEGYSFFIFAEYRNYLEVLRDALLSANLGINKESIILRGGSTPDDLIDAQNGRIILTTYSYSRRGLSLKHMTGLIMATPRKRGMQQLIGRILRKGYDNSIPRIVYDVVDNSNFLKYQWVHRLKYYKSREYKVSKVKF